jgi:hypothetical protein
MIPMKSDMVFGVFVDQVYQTHMMFQEGIPYFLLG